MREASFVKRNKNKWLLFEDVLDNKEQISPDKLSDLYIEITDDLSYAKTFYPQSNTASYLNSIASKAHQKIYITKRESKNKIVSFWKYEFPLFFQQYHLMLFYTFLLFSISTCIGIVSTLNDDSFIRLILGDAYVNETINNIEKGDPTAIYKSGSEIGTFLGITINNIRVAFVAYAFGVITSIGTAWILFRNGIMLGAFFTFFYFSI